MVVQKKQKLELTWIGKENRPKLEPRILLEDTEKSYHAKQRVGEKDIFDNRLIFGDNLLALKALEQEFAGKIKCIYIDPPYNTGSAFTHYDDGIEHSLWLSLMRDRLEILRRLLTDDGALWVTLDDNEVHYCKVLMDELFGRSNFVISVAWEKDQGRRNDTHFSSAHDHILVYAKKQERWRSIRNLLPRTDALNARYKNPDDDPRGPWLQGGNGTAKSGSEKLRFEITLPSGRVVTPPSGNYWRFSPDSFALARKEGRVWFGRGGDSMPVVKCYLNEVQDGVVPRSWWPADEAGSNQGAKRDHLRKLLPDIEPFGTPKPEELLHRIITISTNPGDWVLDCFAGSGTTGAVAHKMGRRWIMAELGEHCHTHIIPRLRKVIDGEDKGGITEAANWKGGGGFRYYNLAPSLLQKDRWGNWVISRARVEPRVLLPDVSLSYHADRRVSRSDSFDNRLVFGDNLLAVKALEQEFAGKIKCIYIDPPYNTGAAFAQYDDGIEHSQWLSLMRDRLEILRRLLADDGSIWVQIDDNEHAYLKVLMDEVFGRANFINTIVWQKKYAVKSDTEFISESHEYVVVYGKDRSRTQLHRLPRTEQHDSRYENPDDDPRGPWTSGPLQRNEARDYAIFPIVSPTGKQHMPPKGTSWRFTKEKVAELIAENRIWFGKSGNNVPRFKRFLTDVADTVPATTWWDYKESGHNDEARRESKLLSGDSVDVFATPKPERLLQRIIGLTTREGDWVLDSFAGSGTTGAVAHKMGRRWIMVELGEHCHTHIIPRLKKVIDGEDKGGITEAVDWKGGGGFRYYKLAPSLLEKDRWGNWVISKEFNSAMLAEALCKLEGFTYAPSDSVFWQHGHSTEQDFVYVTTQQLTADQLQELSDEVGIGRTLLVLCPAFRGKPERWPNLTVKKIPKQVLSRCEWGHDDYSLKIENLPQAEPTVKAARDSGKLESLLKVKNSSQRFKVSK